MDLSIIIVNWNTKKLLQNCLQSIYKHTPAPRHPEPFVESGSTQDDGKREKGITFEVIVVDNGSKDGSVQMVKERFAKASLISNKDNMGFTKANNQGIKIAKGAYILLLNSDTYLIENSLSKLVKVAQNLPNLGALGPQLLNEDKSIQQSAGFFPNLPQVFFWMTFIDDLPGTTFLRPYHIDHDSFYKKERLVDWVTAAAILVPKDVIKRTGGFDEKIFMYGEEVEWCYRIKQAGKKVYFFPSTKIVHIGRGSSNKVSQNAIVGEYKGILYFYEKHKRDFSLQIVHFLLKIGALARIIIFWSLGRKELVKAYVESLKVA